MIVCIVLTVCVVVSSTLAYLVVKTDILSNIFSPTKISFTINGTSITNTSEIPVYARLTVVVTLQSTSDPDVYYGGITLVNGSDYTITESTSPNWSKGSDGYYYYVNMIDESQTITAPTFTATLTNSAKASIPTGYRATVQYLVSGIQATPTDAITDSWGGSVNANGIYTPA